MKREAISKRTRFEVFKRDQFKCQYCGAAAPEVLLTVDHIRPVADGGGRDLLNLITACNVCNAGKAAVPLSDSAAVTKQMAQVRLLAERREQMEMLVKWRDGLSELETEKVEIVAKRIDAFLGARCDRVVNEFGRQSIRRLVKKFGLDACLTACDALTDEVAPNDVFSIVERYAGAAARVAKEPELRDFWRIRAWLRGKRIRFGPDWAPINDMRKAYKLGWTISDMERSASSATTYKGFLIGIGWVFEEGDEE